MERTQTGTFGSIRLELVDDQDLQIYGPAGFEPDLDRASRSAYLYMQAGSVLNALACALHQQAAAQRGLASLGLGR